MDANERAEKIVAKFLAPWAELFKSRIEMVAAQIREAEKEAVEALPHDVHSGDCSRCVQIGRASMWEECLEWVMAFRGDDGTSQKIEEKIHAIVAKRYK